MCSSDSALEYKKQNPEATNSQVTLYGTNTKTDFPKSNWLIQVTQESTKNGF
jgi:hypothetical protein